MQNQGHQTHYQPVNCWKCKTQNNIARNSLCRHCGSVLSTFGNGETSNLHSFSISDLPYFKWIIGIVAFSTLFMVVFMHFFKNTGEDFSGSEMPAAERVRLVLPENSWYNESLWSYVRSDPFVWQILKKNKQVSGIEIDPNQLGMLRITGNLLATKTPLRSSICGKNYTFKNQPDDPVFIANYPSCENSYHLSYQELGKMEITIKKPDKMLRIINSQSPNLGNLKVLEGLSDKGAWRKTINSNSKGQILNTKTEDLSPHETLEAQQQIESIWKTNITDFKNPEFAGLKAVNEVITFVVKSTKNGEPHTFYFDSVTGYLIKLDTPQMTMFLLNYKDYEGTKLPSVFVYRTSEKADEYLWLWVEIRDWKTGGVVEDSIFEKPTR